MSEAPSEPASPASTSSGSSQRREIPPIVHGLALFVVFLGFLVYPFTGSSGTNLLAGLILLAYLGAHNVFHAPFQRLHDWLTSRERLKNLLLAMSVVVVFFGAIEAVGQGVTRAGWIESYSAIRTQLPQGVADFRRFHITSDKYRVSDPVLLWRPIDRWPYNDQRMKGPLAEIPKPPGLFRIMSFGDSNTDGPDEGAWSERLQHLLEARGDRQFQVLNAGVTGYSSHQGLLRFRQTVADFGPDLIFVSFGWNDAAPGVNGPDKVYRPPSAWVIGIERFFLRYRFLRAIKALRAPEEQEMRRDVDVPARVSLEDYHANLRSFLDEAQAHSAVPVFLTRPYTLPRATMENEPRDMRRRVPSYNDELRSFAAESAAILIDVQERFAVESHPDVATLFSDDSHFNEEGSQVMADFLHRRLIEEGVLPPIPQHDSTNTSHAHQLDAASSELESRP